MLLNLLNLFSLIFAMFTKINSINNKLDVMRRHCEPDKNGTFTNRTSLLLNQHDTTTLTTASLFTAAATAIGELVPTEAINSLATMAKNAFTENFKGVTQCVDNVVNCSSTTMVTSLLALNFTTSIYPEIMKQLNVSTTVSSWDSDIFSSSSLSTFTDIYDENTTTDYNATTIFTSSAYPMDSSTTIISFDDKLNDDYEATTPSSDDYYEYDDPSKFVTIFTP